MKGLDVQGLGDALLGVGVDPQSPVTRWGLAYTRRAADLAPGEEITANLQGAGPLTDREGRHAHVLALRIHATARVTVGATTNGAVLASDMLSSFITNIFLSDVGDHFYFTGATPRNVRDDFYIRTMRTEKANAGSPLPAMPAFAADHGTAEDVDVPFTFTIWFANPTARGAESIKGAIPLAALMARSDAFKFTVGTGFVTTNAPASLTNAGLVGSNLEVWLKLVYLDGAVIDRGWHVEEYTRSDLEGVLRHSNRSHEYCYVAHEPYETGANTISDYDGVTVQCNGEVLIPSMTLARWSRHTLNTFADDYINDGGGEPDLLVSNVLRLGEIVGARQGNRHGLAAGVIQYKFNTRSTHTVTRFLHRTIAAQNNDRIAKIVAAMGFPVGTKVSTLDGRAPAADAIVLTK